MIILLIIGNHGSGGEITITIGIGIINIIVIMIGIVIGIILMGNMVIMGIEGILGQGG